MTHENENHDGIGSPTTEPQDHENILLNWILMFVGFGAIAAIVTYFRVFL